jgi:hypothetical protein
VSDVTTFKTPGFTDDNEMYRTFHDDTELYDRQFRSSSTMMKPSVTSLITVVVQNETRDKAVDTSILQILSRKENSAGLVHYFIGSHLTCSLRLVCIQPSTIYIRGSEPAVF